MAIEMMKIIEEKEEELMMGVSYEVSDGGEEEQGARENGNRIMGEAVVREEMQDVQENNDEAADEENTKEKIKDDYRANKQVTKDNENIKKEATGSASIEVDGAEGKKDGNVDEKDDGRKEEGTKGKLNYPKFMSWSQRKGGEL